MAGAPFRGANVGLGHRDGDAIHKVDSSGEFLPWSFGVAKIGTRGKFPLRLVGFLAAFHVSLPEFMNFKPFGKTILVVNLKFGLFLGGHPLSQ